MRRAIRVLETCGSSSAELVDAKTNRCEWATYVQTLTADQKILNRMRIEGGRPCTGTHVCTYIHIYIYTHIHIYTYTYIYIYTHIDAYTYEYINIYIYMHIYIYVYVSYCLLPILSWSPTCVGIGFERPGFEWVMLPFKTRSFFLQVYFPSKTTWF